MNLSKVVNDLLLIGLDGAQPQHVLKFSKEGILPNITSLMEKGFFSKALPSPPNQTATNWTTIATGAWTGTHGLSGFFIHLPGDPINILHQSQNTELCGAEFLWDVAEKVGKKCLIYNYHPSWPPTIKDGIIVLAEIPPSRQGSRPSEAVEKSASKKTKIEQRPTKMIPFFVDERAFRKSYPKEVIGEIERNVKKPELTGAIDTEILDPVEFVAEAKRMAKYHADCLQFLKKKYRWNFLIAQIHILDILNHRYTNPIWPGWPEYTPEVAEEAWEVYRQTYHTIDNMVGRIVKECSDNNSLIVIVADHGNIPSSKRLILGNALQRAGLMSFNVDPKSNRTVTDWANSKVAIRSGYICVNLKGREADGIVDPKDYDEVVEKVIQALTGIRDPKTGECPIVFAVRKKDAASLGQWGERVGDVVYFIKPGYQEGGLLYQPSGKDVIPKPGRESNHGGYLPNASLGPCSDMSTLIIKGPGVREGYIRPRSVNLVDVAPTIAHLIGMPTPAQAEGNIIYDALKDSM